MQFLFCLFVHSWPISTTGSAIVYYQRESAATLLGAAFGTGLAMNAILASICEDLTRVGCIVSSTTNRPMSCVQRIVEDIISWYHSTDISAKCATLNMKTSNYIVASQLTSLDVRRMQSLALSNFLASAASVILQFRQYVE